MSALFLNVIYGVLFIYYDINNKTVSVHTLHCSGHSYECLLPDSRFDMTANRLGTKGTKARLGRSGKQALSRLNGALQSKQHSERTPMAFAGLSRGV